MKPIVAIVGRPNVGKSTFFNKIAGKKISIVENIKGVTRDRIYQDTDWRGYAFTLIDTGGIELKSEDEMYHHIKKQVDIAIDLADSIIFIVDLKDGLMPQDYDIADYLRKSGKPVVLVVNKVDNFTEDSLFEFYSLGLGEPLGVSSSQGLGTGEVLDEVVRTFKARNENSVEEESIKVAFVGKPNAGKSSLVNKILGDERTIVSDIAGTTRDAIDTPTIINGKNYTIIDTAGIRRKRSVDDDIEYYSVLRAIAAIKRADVCVIVFDSAEDISEQDVRIAGMVHESGKPSIIVMNKWDLIEKDTSTINRYNDKLKTQLSFMDYFVPVYTSAITGQRVDNIFKMVDKVYQTSSFRPTTGILNEVITEAVRMNEPPTKNGRRLKIRYATAVSSNPPTIVIFVNDQTLVHFSYKRYIENSLRRAFDFSGTPIKIIFRSKEEDK